MEGCSRFPVDGQTVGQKLDRVIGETNLALIEAGDSLGSKVDHADTTVSSVAATISDRALIWTLEVPDSAITASIMTDLIRDPALGPQKIDVETRDGVVWLNGLTEDRETRERAEQIARSIKGVVSVNNHLSVKRI